MQLGVIFPQTEIGADPKAVRDFVQAAEGIGYEHVIVFDHVLGVDTAHYPGWQGPYTKHDMFHEPFVLYGYLAAVTQRIEMVTAVIILGQRQTALVAKQAAEVDVLSGGRLRLGVGLGWNHVEYEALGEDFHTRGRRIEEQVSVLRKLWTEPLVNYRGKEHVIDNAGISPMPVQRPIPIWFGGGAEPALKRAARLADGWMPAGRKPDDAMKRLLEYLEKALAQAGRARRDFGIDPWISIQGLQKDE